MRYLIFSPIIFTLAFLLYYYVGVYQPQKEALLQNQQSELPEGTGEMQWETKSDNEGPVAITITPIAFGEDADQWRFTVVFNTHSGSLDQDPTKVISVSDDKENTYQPIAWEGPGPGGHHREGALMFDPVEPSPEYVELKIRDVGGIAERSFRWDTK